MKKSVSIGLSIFGGLFVVALMLPWLISLNQYKTMIQDKAFEATGRQILINGDIRFGILPAPYARLTDVVITNPKGTISKDFASVKSVDVGVALAPLFSKQIRVTHITVTEPAITLEIMENGQNNWQFTPEQTDPKPTEDNVSQKSDPAKISIDNLTIEKGFIRYVNTPEKSQQTVGPIDARFKVDSLQGPVSGIGTATILGKLPLRFDARIDALPSTTNSDIPFTLGLGVMNNAATASLKGVAKTGDDMTARVETAVTITDLAKILAAMNKDNKAPALPDYLKGKASMTGLLEWQDQKAAINNLMLNAGSMEIHGSFAAAIKNNISVVIDLTRVALPPEAAQASRNQGSNKSGGTDTNLAKTLQDIFAQASGFLDTDLPKNNINVVLTASQLPIPNQPILRDIRIAASLAASGLTLQNAELKLPGNTHIKLRGTLPARADGKIDKVVIQSDITSDNITAASGKNSGAEKMPIAIQATTTLSREMVRINPLNLSQKGQSVQGDIIYNPKTDPVLTLALTGSALNLDSFMAQDKKIATTQTGSRPTTQSANTDPLSMLQGLKAKLNIDLGAVTFQNKTAKKITANALISDKGLELQKASIGDLGGMVIDASGKISRLSPLGGASLQAQARTPNLSTTLKALGNTEAANLGASNFTATLQGDDKALDFGLNGTIDQGKIAVNGRAANLTSSPSFNGKIDIAHPETATILRNFAKMTPTVSLGAFALQSDIAYGADTIKADKLLIKLGSAGSLQGHINITPDGQQGRKIDADIRGDKLALAALMGDDNKTDAGSVDVHNPNQAQQPWSNEPINLDALRGLNGKANIEIGELLYKKFIIRNLKTTAVFADNTVTLQRLGGSLFDAGTFNVQGQLAAGSTGQAHRGDFTIAINKTDAVKLFAALGSKPFAKGIVNMNQNLRFSGASPHQLVSNLNGDGQIKVDDVIINGLDLDALAERLDRPNSISDFAAIINQASAGGQTAIGNLDIPITIRNGVASMADTVIKTQRTEMLLKGLVQLPPKQVDMTGQITFIEQRNLPPLTLFIKGPMNNPQKNFDTRGFTNFYAQKATEKLQDKIGEKIQDGLGKLLGTPKQAAPAANSPAAAPASVPAPVAPTSPAPASTAPAAPQPQQQDPLKQLGNEMLQNILGGGRR